MKPILLTITGMSPQVITETLFALDAEKQVWPEEIYVITTLVGETKIKKGLLEEGHLIRLCNEINRPLPKLEIWVIPDGEGREVDDARSQSDHEALANFIMEKTAMLTKDDTTQIHTSIAGGRKTMTYYMGYAMSLFGRKQDRLSHVLVTDGYENLEQFYYPSKLQADITENYGKTIPTKSPSKAEVILADIPFIRLRNNLSGVLEHLGDKINFRQLVALFNIANFPEDHQFVVDVPHQTLRFIDKNNQVVSELFVENTFAFAWYLTILRTMVDESLDKITRPKSNKGEKGDRFLATLILNEMLNIFGHPALDQTLYETSAMMIEAQSKLICEVTASLPQSGNIEKTLETIKSYGSIVGHWFSSRRDALATILKEALPMDLVHLLLPRQITNNELANTDDQDENFYVIDYPKENIQFIEHE